MLMQFLVYRATCPEAPSIALSNKERAAMSLQEFSNVDDEMLNNRQRHPVLLDDLTSVIDTTLIVAFVASIYFLRQRNITVATLAHALSVVFLVFSVGHYIERHMIGVDGVDDLVRRRYRQGGADWLSAGMVSTAAITALVARFWNCRGVGVDCVVGDTAPIHYPCKRMRLKFFAPVFASTVVFVYVCISARLNALLGGSVLHPQGGGYAAAVLASPSLASTMCVAGCASVWLYSILVEAQQSGPWYDPRAVGVRHWGFHHEVVPPQTQSGSDSTNQVDTAAAAWGAYRERGHRPRVPTNSIHHSSADDTLLHQSYPGSDALRRLHRGSVPGNAGGGGGNSYVDGTPGRGEATESWKGGPSPKTRTVQQLPFSREQAINCDVPHHFGPTTSGDVGFTREEKGHNIRGPEGTREVVDAPLFLPFPGGTRGGIKEGLSSESRGSIVEQYRGKRSPCEIGESGAPWSSNQAGVNHDEFSTCPLRKGDGMLLSHRIIPEMYPDFGRSERQVDGSTTETNHPHRGGTVREETYRATDAINCKARTSSALLSRASGTVCAFSDRESTRRRERWGARQGRGDGTTKTLLVDGWTSSSSDAGNSSSSDDSDDGGGNINSSSSEQGGRLLRNALVGGQNRAAVSGPALTKSTYMTLSARLRRGRAGGVTPRPPPSRSSAVSLHSGSRSVLSQGEHARPSVSRPPQRTDRQSNPRSALPFSPSRRGPGNASLTTTSSTSSSSSNNNNSSINSNVERGRSEDEDWSIVDNRVAGGGDSDLGQRTFRESHTGATSVHPSYFSYGPQLGEGGAAGIRRRQTRKA